MTNYNDVKSMHAANPLLQPLGPYVATRADWIPIIAHNPLKGVDALHLSDADRNMYLEDIKHRFTPTRSSLDIVADLQDMMWAGLRSRNPLIVDARAKQNAMLATMAEARSLNPLPWFSTTLQCKMIYGVTGVGKTHPVERFLELLPKMVIHRDDAIPGWRKVTQIMALYVKMTHDGYRGGFLLAILAAVDAQCGTDYSDQFKRERVEVLAVRVCQILISHHVGLLVIDDLQVKNFALGPERDTMLLLFLKLLDCGIPMVLIGSPLAFVDIRSFSQDNRRLTSVEPQELMPFESLDQPDWGKSLIPGLWSHSVMPQKTPLSPEIVDIVHYESAGFAHYNSVICKGVQKYGLRRGIKQITVELLKEYVAQSSTLADNRTLLHGFRTKNHNMLSAMEDVPWMEYGLRWGTMKLEEVLEADTDGLSRKRAVKRTGRPSNRDVRLQSLQKRLATRYQAEQTRRKNEASKKAGKRFDSEDIRGDGLRDVHAKGLKAIREAVTSSTD